MILRDSCSFELYVSLKIISNVNMPDSKLQQKLLAQWKQQKLKRCVFCSLLSSPITDLPLFSLLLLLLLLFLISLLLTSILMFLGSILKFFPLMTILLFWVWVIILQNFYFYSATTPIQYLVVKSLFYIENRQGLLFICIL